MYRNYKFAKKKYLFSAKNFVRKLRLSFCVAFGDTLSISSILFVEVIIYEKNLCS